MINNYCLVELIARNLGLLELITRNLGWFELIARNLGWFELITWYLRWLELITRNLGWFELITWYLRWLELITRNLGGPGCTSYPQFELLDLVGGEHLPNDTYLIDRTSKDRVPEIIVKRPDPDIC
jgi:hypothetical protein